MDPKKLSTILLILFLLFMVLGIKTLLPNQGASKPCLLGYKAGCSFTPISSLILFWIGAAIFAYRARLINGAGTKLVPGWFIVLTALFLVFVILFSCRYVALKKSYVSRISSRANVSGEGTEAKPFLAQDQGRNRE